MTTQLRQFYALDWSSGVVGAIANQVRQLHPHLIHRWPCVKSHGCEIYRVGTTHAVIIVRSADRGTPTVNAIDFPQIEYSDHPRVEASGQAAPLWCGWLIEKYSLEETDFGLFIPLKDSGIGALQDFGLFSAEEQNCYHWMFNFFIARQLKYIQRPIEARLTEEKRCAIEEINQVIQFVAVSQIGVNAVLKTPQLKGSEPKWAQNIGDMEDREITDISGFYVPALGCSQLVSAFENFLFNCFENVLLSFPHHIDLNKKIDIRDVVDSSSKEQILALAVQRFLNELKYKRVSEWFNYLEKTVSISLSDKTDEKRVAEIKATRDCFIHNGGFSNATYERKSGELARRKAGDKLPIDNNYFEESYKLFQKLVSQVGDDLTTKFASDSTVEESVNNGK